MSEPNFANIPQELKDRKQWVLWKSISRAGKPTKVPYQTNGVEADSSDPTTWAAFEAVVNCYRKGGYDGVGFVFDRASGVSGVDLDHCRDPATGEIDPWARSYSDRLDSYTEISPSGGGLHILVRGSIPVTGKDGGRKKTLKGEGYRPGAAIEMYSAKRFFTMTGNALPEHPQTVESRQGELSAIYEEAFGKGEPSPQDALSVEVEAIQACPVREQLEESARALNKLVSAGSLKSTDVIQALKRAAEHSDIDDDEIFSIIIAGLLGACPKPVDRKGTSALSDDEIIRRATAAQNGGKFKALFDGSTSEYGGDDSAADMALMNALAFWTGGNALQMERLFSSSGLGKRDKWITRPDYRERTIKKAISDTKEFYGDASRQEKMTPTVIDAIRLLAGVCDGALSKDGTGFSKFDREEHEDLIEKALTGGDLSPKEEKVAYRFLKKYKKQLKGLGLAFSEIGHISRDGEAIEDGLAKINERIPVWIAGHHFKTVSDTERLYRYDHGVYLDDGETVLKTLVETEFGDVTSNRLVADVIGKVKRRTYVNRDLFNNKNVLNVKNGLLDLETLQLLPHTPDYLSTAQIDVTYNPDAKAPTISKFLEEVAQAGDIALIEEIIGWLLWPDYNVHKAVMFLGPGRNGKGTLLRLITAFLGKKSISNVTLQDLVADRFAKADLYGKLANIGGDLPSKDLSDTAAFRNLTGGDDNRAQEKYRPAFSFRNKAKLVFSANVLPRSPDDTYAFYSRWILIEFLKVFDLQKGTADPDLDAKLQTPEELSGLLNIALAGLKRLKANGWKFSYDKTVEDVEIMYKRNANPVIAFLMDECEEDPGSYVEKGVFLSRFRDYSARHNLRPMTITRFGQLLKDQSVIPLSDHRPDSPTGKALPRCWLGVKLKSPSTPSIVLPTPIFPKMEKKEREIKKKMRGDRVYETMEGVEGQPGIGHHPRKDEPTPGGEAIKQSGQVVALYFLQDRGPYKKDSVVAVRVEGDFSPIPGVCRRLECGECSTAIRGDPPLCEPCKYLGSVLA